MTLSIRYQIERGVATISIDDGKVNALSLDTFNQVDAALDAVMGQAHAIVLRGRQGVFSAGFDLPTLRRRDTAARRLVRQGFELLVRLLTTPACVIAVVEGHAVAMGSFLLLVADLRLGAAGDYRVTANEVAIGLTLPHTAVALMRGRLAPNWLGRVALLSEPLNPAAACAAGFLDELTAGAAIDALLGERLAAVGRLDARALRASKARLQAPLVAELERAIALDFPGGGVGRGGIEASV